MASVRNRLYVSSVFQTEQWVASPIEKVFRFFSDPRNLTVISPPSSGAQLKALHLVSPPLPGIEGSELLAGAGSEIVVSIRLLPYLPLRRTWTARVIEYDWCDHFRDVQVNGPFKTFDHTHSFQARSQEGKPGTLIHDRVVFDVGLGPPGQLVNIVFVRRLLSQMFAYRHAATARALDS